MVHKPNGLSTIIIVIIPLHSSSFFRHKLSALQPHYNILAGAVTGYPGPRAEKPGPRYPNKQPRTAKHTGSKMAQAHGAVALFRPRFAGKRARHCRDAAGGAQGRAAICGLYFLRASAGASAPLPAARPVGLP